MDDKELDKVFRRQLKRQEMAVPESIWDKVEEELNHDQKRKGFIWWPLGVAASVILMITLFWPANEVNVLPDEGNIVSPTQEESIFLNPPQPSPVLQAPGEKPLQNRSIAKASQKRTHQEAQSLLAEIGTPDYAEDRKRSERFLLYTTVIKTKEKEPKSSYLKVQFASADELLPQVSDPKEKEPYDEKLKAYAFNSIGNLFRGDSISAPPTPEKNPVDQLEKGINQVMAFQRDLFGRKKENRTQP